MVNYCQLIEQCYKDFFLSSYELISPQALVHRIKTTFPENEIARIATRLWLDPYYKLLFEKTLSFQKCLDAGYFDDGLWDSVFLNLDDEVSNLLTPYQSVLESVGIKEYHEKPLAVLLTTGCFAPVHKGHFDMMENAKVEVQKAGYRVVGGYMSPSHDNYLRTKIGDNPKLHIMKRIQLLELAAQEYPWINIDPWEGVYNSVSINFTDVIEYIKNYLNYHIDCGRKIEVFYVFGADNAHFVDTFNFKGHCVVVNRFNHDMSNVIINIQQKNNLNLLYSNKLVSREISSTVIRKGYLEHLPSSVLEVYRNSLTTDEVRTNINIAIRKDCQYSLSDWIEKSDKSYDYKNKMIDQYNDLFSIELKSLLSWAFESDDTQIYDIDVKKQLKYIRRLRSVGNGLVVSLDPLCPVGSNIRISRLFAMSGNQLKRIQTVTESVKINNSYKSKKCYVVDDDIVSGKTMDFVCKAYIPKNLEIIQVSLLEHGLEKADKKIEFDEILDERDFLLGSKGGGLKCLLPNGAYCRVPYLLPFVNPTWRANMDANSCIQFSREVWLRNVDFFSVYNQITVGDSDIDTQTFLKYLGYDAKTPLLEIAINFWSIMNRYKF